MRHPEYFLYLVAAVIAVVCVIAAFVNRAKAARLRTIAPGIKDWTKRNFKALCNKDDIITEGSLHTYIEYGGDKARARFLLGELDTIGHRIGTDKTAQGAAAITTAMSSPSTTPIVMAGFGIYGISREDIEAVTRIDVGSFGKVSVWKRVKKDGE